MANKKTINFTFSSSVTELRMEFDPEKLRKIVYNLGFTPREYFNIWRDFVNWRDYKCLVQHYSDCRTNEIYCNCYYSIYCTGTDVSLDYLNNSPLYSAFRIDSLRQNQKLVKHKALVEQLKGI